MKLGSKAVVEAARKVNQNLSQLASQPPPSNVQELKDSTVVLEGEFEVAVRPELGSGGCPISDPENTGGR
jgi:hypothetical protein